MTASETLPAFSWWHAPEGLVDSFAAAFRVSQQELAKAMTLAVQMTSSVPADKVEFVADDLAQVMNVHPRTAQTFLFKALDAHRLGLLPLLSSGEITDRHLSVLLEESSLWAGGDDQVQQRIVDLVVARVRARLGSWDRWPAPGMLKKRIAAAALLLDLTAAETRRRSVAERRSTWCGQTAVGEGTFSLTGPEAQIVAVADAVRARAEAYGRIPGDTRTLEQRLYDAAYDLLMADAAGGESAVPALGADGELVTISVRGVELQVLVPYSVTQGGDLELAEIAGFGPILPEAARELMGQAEHVRQVAVDAESGHVISVEDRIPVPRQPEPAEADVVDEPAEVQAAAADGVPAGDLAVAEDRQDHDREDAAAQAEGADPVEAPADTTPALDPWIAAVLDRMLDRPLQCLGPLETEVYRANQRILRRIRARDLTCTFPGCTTPARSTDADHREPWPLGPTSTTNLHCLCRRHHRAKQAYFTVEIDHTGHTTWTTPDGRQYRRPPPSY